MDGLGHVLLECLQQHDAAVQGLWGHVQSGWCRKQMGGVKVWHRGSGQMK